VNRSLFPWLDEHRNDRFFLFVHYFDPHFPYDPPEAFRSGPGGVEASFTDPEKLIGLRKSLKNRPTAGAVEHGKSACRMYAGEVSFMDSQIDALISKLSDLDLIDRSVILVMGDHGEMLMEQQEEFFNHGFTVYEGAMHVPLIFYGPSCCPSGLVVDDLVSTLDIAPTLCELTGLSALETYQGRSLVPLWSAPGDQARRGGPQAPIFCEATKPQSEARQADPEWPNQLKTKCLRTGRWKLIHDPLEPPSYRLYDLAGDPQEKNDIFDQINAENPDLIKGLTRTLQSWMNDLPARRRGNAVMSEDVRKKLELLGYTE
jgi:arylsulfatase A-like enzyme